MKIENLIKKRIEIAEKRILEIIKSGDIQMLSENQKIPLC